MKWSQQHSAMFGQKLFDCELWEQICWSSYLWGNTPPTLATHFQPGFSQTWKKILWHKKSSKVLLGRNDRKWTCHTLFVVQDSGAWRTCGTGVCKRCLIKDQDSMMYEERNIHSWLPGSNGEICRIPDCKTSKDGVVYKSRTEVCQSSRTVETWILNQM